MRPSAWLELGMGTGTDAEEVAEGPVVQVVPRLSARLGIGGGLVLAIAVLAEQCLAGLLNVPEDVVFRQLRWLAPEQGVRFRGQLVPGQVRRLLGDGGAQVAQRILRALVRQAMHEVEVEVFEACGTGHVRCADGFAAVVDAPERLELAAGNSARRSTID